MSESQSPSTQKHENLQCHPNLPNGHTRAEKGNVSFFKSILTLPSLMSHSMSMLNRLGPIARMIFNCSLGHKLNETLTVLSSNPTIEGVFQNRICGFFIYIVSM